MYNPLTPDLEELSIDELTKRLSKLNARMVGARQSGSQAVMNQIGVMIAETSEALAKRSTDMLRVKKKENPEYDEAKDPENPSSIDIGE
jgi:hypothetical protein|tara:strand:- start:194 stop:460 length:267 start_codon:yes stop_codon:yes gene_type:complete